eukprot:4944794-Prymnesium_polylepis.2
MKSERKACGRSPCASITHSPSRRTHARGVVRYRYAAWAPGPRTQPSGEICGVEGARARADGWRERGATTHVRGAARRGASQQRGGGYTVVVRGRGSTKRVLRARRALCEPILMRVCTIRAWHVWGYAHRGVARACARVRAHLEPRQLHPHRTRLRGQRAQKGELRVAVAPMVARRGRHVLRHVERRLAVRPLG